MPLNTTQLNASLQARIEATTAQTDEKTLLLLAKAIESATPTITQSDVIQEGATQVAAVTAEGQARLAAVTAEGQTQVAAVTAEGQAQLAVISSNIQAAIGLTVQAYDADIPTVAASQVEMEAGTEAALRSMSPLRVAQAIAALASPVSTGKLYFFGQS